MHSISYKPKKEALIRVKSWHTKNFAKDLLYTANTLLIMQTWQTALIKFMFPFSNIESHINKMSR